MLTLSYEFKLKPTQEQVQEIEHILAVCRQVWNHALRSRKDWIKSRKSPVNACSLVSEYIMSPNKPYPNYAKQCKALTEAKQDFPELRTVNAQVLQQVLRRLETAFLDMQRKQMGFPRFKNRYRMRSFVFPQMLKNCLDRNKIKLPLGIDLNLANFLATSNGEIIARPRFLSLLSRKIKLLQRRLKHKKKNSNNRRKLSQKIARLHQRVSEIRKDWHYKLAHHLCDSAGMIFAEDINFKAWAKGMLRKHTLDAGFGQFLSILQWVAWRKGVFFAKVNKDYTSQQCPECGTHTGKKELDERVHSCPVCGYTCNRDVAAAQVVRNRGVSAVGQVVEQVAFGGVLSGASA